MDRENIILVNAHWSNHGDEAAVRAVIEEIHKQKPDARVFMMIKDKKKVKGSILVKNRPVRCIANQFLPNSVDYVVQLLSKGRVGRNPAMKRFLTLLGKADFIIYAPGGSVINDRFWWRKQLEYMLPLWYARLYKKPLYVASPSVGPFEAKYKIRNFFRRRLFSGVKYLFVRERMSYEFLKEIGAAGNARVTIDSAFCSEVDTKAQEELFYAEESLSAFMERYPKVVGVTITELDWNVKYKDKDIAQEIRSAMQGFLEFLQQSGYGVLLIPQLFENQDDCTLLETYRNRRENMLVLNPEYSADFQQYLISRLYLVVGMRYHSNIFSAKMGVPFLPVIYEEKMESFVREAGLLQYAVQAEKISADSLKEQFLRIVGEHDVYKEILRGKREEWAKRAKRTKKSLRDFFIENRKR